MSSTMAPPCAANGVKQPFRLALVAQPHGRPAVETQVFVTGLHAVGGELVVEQGLPVLVLHVAPPSGRHAPWWQPGVGLSQQKSWGNTPRCDCVVVPGPPPAG